MGKVYIVGAGPGDPELITIKAMKAIQKADVILYDRLVNKELLAYAKKKRISFIAANCQITIRCAKRRSISF